VVHKVDGNNPVFMPSKKGLFYSGTKNDAAHVLINIKHILGDQQLECV